jgi:hypothetical protein
VAKKKKTKKDIHQEMMIAAMDRGTNVDQDRLKAELARSRFIQHAFQVNSLTKLNKQKGDLSDRKKQIKLEIMQTWMGTATRSVARNTNAIVMPILSGRRLAVAKRIH